MKNRRLIEIVMVVVSTSLLTCKLTQVKSDDAPGPGGNRSEGNTFAGTFQGTFSVGRLRVRAPEGSTALMVANLDWKGESRSLRSFAGLAPGRAVASTPMPGRGIVVVGVFKNKLDFEIPKQQPLDSERVEGLFFAVITSTGRVTSARTIALAEHFASPSVFLRGDKVIVEVPYKGPGQVDHKPVPPGNGKTILQLVASQDGTVTTSEPPAGDYAPRISAQTMTAGSCNICVPNLPRDACGEVRDLVCPGDTWCCDSGWDRQCMDEAFQRYPKAQQFCNCPHSAAAAGVFMYRMCLDAHASHNCVLPLCGIDTFCGDSEWDGMCVNEAAPMSACTGA